MQSYHVVLESNASESFRSVLAANSVDLDVKKKLRHELKITPTCDVTSGFNVGLIIGASGSGKTTLARKIYGENFDSVRLDEEKTILDQMPSELSYDECVSILSGIGLTAVTCWVRPVKTLSNGQKARALAALAMTKNDLTVIDEWTSVVDRTVARVMSHCVQKFARRNSKSVVLISCHYDVVEWLDPDWVIDCNTQTFVDRRLLHPDERKRRERLVFDIRETDSSTWRYFSRYHYLGENLPVGKNFYFGLFQGENQIGFQCFSNYVPTRTGSVPILHFNRTVIHPDYCGLGLGGKLITETSKIVSAKGFRVMGKFSSVAVAKLLSRDENWRFLHSKVQIGRVKAGRGMIRRNGFRENVKTFHFEFVPRKK